MATAPNPSSSYTSNNFVAAAGLILFRQKPSSPLQVCILFHRDHNEYLLPKGRKDCGESMAVCAVRETYEETGYKCALLPCRMPTRQPLPGTNTHDAVDFVDECVEPFTITVRHLPESRMKMIWWFITRAISDEKDEGTQTATEQFDSHWVDATEVVERLTFQVDREIVATALQIVKDTEKVRGGSLFV